VKNCWAKAARALTRHKEFRLHPRTAGLCDLGAQTPHTRWELGAARSDRGEEPSTQRAPEHMTGFDSWHRRPQIPEGTADRRRSNLDTPSQPRGRLRVRMLLSFQRPPYLFWKGLPSQGYARDRRPIPGRADEDSTELWSEPTRVVGLPERLPTPSGRSGNYLNCDRPGPRAIVEVDQHDLLPGPQGQTAVDDGDRLGGAYQRRP
jgi:hypothetical protein